LHHKNAGEEGDSSNITSVLRLLKPGIRIKRWVILWILGISFLSIGIGYFATRIDPSNSFDFLPWHLEGVILLFAGCLIIATSIFGLYKTISILIPTLGNISDALYTNLSREKGPNIVVIGGGTGMSVLLKGLKQHTDNLTAIIGVADDGGSSGRLRRELGVIPPGDFRNCIVAMSDEESLLPELFQYRFTEGEGLKGHSFGNLFIVAMSHVTDSFQSALSESSKVLAVRGKITPATTANLNLSARMTNGKLIAGESNITAEKGTVERLYINPPFAKAYGPSEESILEADLVVIGPGSLYTSILPNLMVPGILDALLTTTALRIYVCNVATEVGETQNFFVEDHVNALMKHTDENILDYVIANNNIIDIGDRFMGNAVPVSNEIISNIQVAYTDLLDTNHPVRHDSNKLAEFILSITNNSRR
tara:strand:- start:2640 stop:3905 length:1266 start_codon:yes stop_codon:yes gene_type:complete